MKSKMKMKFKMFFAVLMISILLIGNVSYGKFNIEKANLYYAGECGKWLQKDNVTIKTTVVLYESNGKIYPAYCLNRDIPGVTENNDYTVTTDELLSNSLVYRTILNGYPYKTPSQLGVNSVEEAFFATKHAVYCVLYNSDENNFARFNAISAEGDRILAAMKNIVYAARNSNNSKPSSFLKINQTNDNWNVDNINKSYISKEFSITADAQINNYIIKIDGEIPEGTLITDVNNNVKTQFTQSEKFKINIPIINLTKNGNIKIRVDAGVNTNPIFYGKSSDSNYQDYAITADAFEDGYGEGNVNYFKNSNKIEIIKHDAETGEKISNVEFNILDKDNHIIYSNLITDEFGKIEIENILPGKYFIKETRTKDGYILNEELVEINVEINKQIAITIFNQKEGDIGEPRKWEEQIIVQNNVLNVNNEEKSEKIQVLTRNKIKLPKTGM